MKILKMVLIIVGSVLIVAGLYDIFELQEVLKLDALEVSAQEDLNNQTFGMIGLGIISLMAGAFLTKRKK
jgi:LPXTG-motif cell wall-anchored protein